MGGASLRAAELLQRIVFSSGISVILYVYRPASQEAVKIPKCLKVLTQTEKHAKWRNICKDLHSGGWFWQLKLSFQSPTVPCLSTPSFKCKASSLSTWTWDFLPVTSSTSFFCPSSFSLLYSSPLEAFISPHPLPQPSLPRQLKCPLPERQTRKQSGGVAGTSTASSSIFHINCTTHFSKFTAQLDKQMIHLQN